MIATRMLLGVIHDLLQAGWIWAVLIPLEVLFPRAGQIAARARLKGISLSVIGWCIAGGMDAASPLILRAAGARPLLELHAEPASPFSEIGLLVAGTALAILSYDFFYYWAHRLMHTRWLWRFHAVHHAIEDLGAANYGHWTETLMPLPLIALPSAFLVPTGLPVWKLAAGLMVLQSQYVHSQTRLHFGPFWRVVYDNRFHRIHHSIEEQHFDRNFGVFTPVWDWMFGTLYVPAKGEWPATGIADTPEVDGLGDFLLRPFRASTSRS